MLIINVVTSAVYWGLTNKVEPNIYMRVPKNSKYTGLINKDVTLLGEFDF